MPLDLMRNKKETHEENKVHNQQKNNIWFSDPYYNFLSLRRIYDFYRKQGKCNN